MSDPKPNDFKWSEFEAYLSGEYFPPDKEFTFTIARVAICELWSKKEQRKVQSPVLFFKETRPGLPITSSENRRMLNRLFGNNASACIGKRVRVKMIPRKVAGEQKHPLYIVGNGTSEPGTATTAPAQKSTLDQLWDLAAMHEMTSDAVGALIREHGGDVEAAFAALKKRYAEANT